LRSYMNKRGTHPDMRILEILAVLLNCSTPKLYQKATVQANKWVDDAIWREPPAISRKAGGRVHARV
jgi:hypothetical protein